MIEAPARDVGTACRPDAPRLDERSIFEGRLLGRLGRFEVRLAASADDLRLAQELRYAIFHEGRGLKTSSIQRLTRRDEDRFDRHCDHLLLIDRQGGRLAQQRLIGTYRLLPQDRAVTGFYSQTEFDVASLVSRQPGRRFLELGRSCVRPAYRGLRTMEILWHGVWAYVLAHRIDVLFGCASLPGTCARTLAEPLAVLRARALAPREWQVAPTGRCAQPLPFEPPSGALGDAAPAGLLPPLVKGYLRLGGMVSDHAVADPEFDTTDVLLVLPVERIAPRYIAHYGAAAERYA